MPAMHTSNQIKSGSAGEATFYQFTETRPCIGVISCAPILGPITITECYHVLSIGLPYHWSEFMMFDMTNPKLLGADMHPLSWDRLDGVQSLSCTSPWPETDIGDSPVYSSYWDIQCLVMDKPHIIKIPQSREMCH